MVSCSSEVAEAQGMHAQKQGNIRASLNRITSSERPDAVLFRFHEPPSACCRLFACRKHTPLRRAMKYRSSPAQSSLPEQPEGRESVRLLPDIEQAPVLQSSVFPGFSADEEPFATRMLIMPSKSACHATSEPAAASFAEHLFFGSPSSYASS